MEYTKQGLLWLPGRSGKPYVKPDPIMRLMVEWLAKDNARAARRPCIPDRVLPYHGE